MAMCILDPSRRLLPWRHHLRRWPPEHTLSALSQTQCLTLYLLDSHDPDGSSLSLAATPRWELRLS